MSNFKTLDAKLANSVKKLLAANEIRRKVFIEEQKAKKRKQSSSRKTHRFHDVRLLQDPEEQASLFWISLTLCEFHFRETTSKDSIRSGTKFF